MPLSPSTRYHLRRLHSLTGVVPVGLFLLEHMFTNSFAMFGADAFNAKVAFLMGLPYLIALEVGLIGIPIAFHAVLGVVIWWEGRSNVVRYGYFRNWMYFLQRMSGLFLVVFIAVHVWLTRLSGTPPQQMFQHMQGYLDGAGMALFYGLGVAAAAFHFGNGLFTFAISWGLLPGPRSQRWAEWACLGIAALVAVVGLNSLFAFRSGNQSFTGLNSPHAVHDAAPHEANPLEVGR